MQSLHELIETSLYKTKNVTINDSWLQLNEPEQEMHSMSDSTSSDTDSLSDREHVNQTNTLIHGFIDARSIHNMNDKIIALVPSQELYPIRIFKDKHFEEMNFPTLFYGEPRSSHTSEKLSYQRVAQWELLNSSHEFGLHTKNLFFQNN